VGIPIPELLHAWRERAVDQGLMTGAAGVAEKAEGAVLAVWAAASTQPLVFGMLEKIAGRVPPRLARHLPMLGEWHAGRELPEAHGPTFRERWRGVLGREDAP
jgi:hypothetical protein